MISAHAFIFTPGTWLGEGIISFNASSEQIQFSTRWSIPELENGRISCIQEVEMRESGSEKLVNHLTFYDMTAERFVVELSNEMTGKIVGKGVVDLKTVAWELREKTGFEGFEVYEFQDNGEYLFHAEYASTENFRTIIDGRIWPKAK